MRSFLFTFCRTLFLLSWLALSSALAQTRYVTPTGAGTQAGSSWANALSGTALQGALASAPTGTTFIVAGGLYKPTSTTARTVSFSIASGVQVYGGYTAGTNARTTDPSSTTFSGDIGTVGDSTDNSGHVVVFRNVSEQTRLDGVLITRGQANVNLVSPVPDLTDGGGIFNQSSGSSQRSDPVIANCQITGNYARNDGGGMENVSEDGSTSNPTLLNCRFTNNNARDGAGMDNGSRTGSTSSPTLTNCRFTNNPTTRGGYGGGMYNTSNKIIGSRSAPTGGTTNPSLTNCIFTNNSAFYGAGIANDGNDGTCSPTLTNCQFIANVADIDGGGMYNEAKGGAGGTPGTSSPVLLNCSFIGNLSIGDQGGGMHNYANDAGDVCSPALTNCLFTGNQAFQGAGLWNQTGNGTCRPILTNCTIVNNAAVSRPDGGVFQGGAVYNRRFSGSNGICQPELINCIIWGNTAAEAPGVFNEEGTFTTYRFTNSQDGVQPGEGNCSVDPLFVDAAQGNFQLQVCSPLVDAGDNSVNAGSTDLAGNTRKVRTIDIGAFEFQGVKAVTITQQPVSGSTVCAGATVRVSISASGPVSGYQWYKGGNLVTGQTSATLNLTNAQPDQSGTYSVVVTGSCNSLTSTAFSLTVNPLLSVSLSASGPLTCAQPSVTLSASGQGTYQWSGPNGFASTAQNVTVNAGGSYSVTVRAPNGCTATASTTVESQTALAPPTLLTQSGQSYPGGQSAVSVVQYSPSVILEGGNCGGTLTWKTPGGTTGTGHLTVPTTQTGTFVYSATCQVGACVSAPASATVTVQSAALALLIARYDCATGQLSLRTTGGNGQPVEFHIPSLSNGWSEQTDYAVEAKKLGKTLKIKTRQRQSDGSGWDEATLEFVPTACGGAGRLATEGLEVPLEVVVLGNPVTGQQVEVEVRGASGQPLHLRLVDSQGREVASQQRASAGAIERVSLAVSNQPAGLLLLRVSTPRQIQTVKVLKAD